MSKQINFTNKSTVKADAPVVKCKNPKCGKSFRKFNDFLYCEECQMKILGASGKQVSMFDE